MVLCASSDIDKFIGRWRGCEGERANYQSFLNELCELLGVKKPNPSYAPDRNDYVFERVVEVRSDDGAALKRRIDLYKRDCFVLEAKRSKQTDSSSTSSIFEQPDRRGKRTANRSWDLLMTRARSQAEEYASLLPSDHKWPPFILVCDVGHVIEAYADFSGQGRHYTQFPDRESYRIHLQDLHSHAIRARLAAIWNDPMSLDPMRVSVPVTASAVGCLAAIAKRLEMRCAPEDVALFLMRCIFVLFVEDVSMVEGFRFRDLLRDCQYSPKRFQNSVGQLWEAMRSGGYASSLGIDVPRFGGNLFDRPFSLPLEEEDVRDLILASRYDWREVDPAIFGALLEAVLDTESRKKLGAHYTPRAYVERLVTSAVIEPLGTEWAAVLSTSSRLSRKGDSGAAIAAVSAFHDRLCRVRVLDPACGTGNFLYVALELLKKLEGEVLEALANLGGQEAIRGLESHTVGPHQFLGIEFSQRAAAIAELVLWIGYLQWHFRAKGRPPAEPILRPLENIKQRDALIDWESSPLFRPAPSKAAALNFKQAKWPDAEFIVGNPPFLGGKDIRSRWSDAYAEALWAAYPRMNESADLVMYWWNRAAELLTREGTVLQRFGFVTTNSITQAFQRRVIERHLAAEEPVSLLMAIPDHPWTKAVRKAAAVRVAMTVVGAGRHVGVLREVVSEAGLETDTPQIAFKEATGIINADLSIGKSSATAAPLLAMRGLSSRGMMLFGAGFIVSSADTGRLALGSRPGLDRYIRPYVNGRDLTGKSRNAMVIDLYGLSAGDVNGRYPEVYQHLQQTVKPKRDQNRDPDIASRWWLFGRTRDNIRPALEGLSRYIVTVETAKHRVFQFLDAAIVPDNMLVVIASDDAYVLGVLSSGIHVVWAKQRGGTLEDRPRYTKSHCFDPFPFPAANNIQKQTIRLLAEQLDRHRKTVLAAQPELTLTGLYNVLQKVRANEPLNAADTRVFAAGEVFVLDELHHKLDAAVAAAYGWPVDLDDAAIAARLVALNRERVKEEANGQVRWLRPDYQAERFADDRQVAELDPDAPRVATPIATVKRKWPKGDLAQTKAVLALMLETRKRMTPEEAAAMFRNGKRHVELIADTLWAMSIIGLVEEMDDNGKYIVGWRALRAA